MCKPETTREKTSMTPAYVQKRWASSSLPHILTPLDSPRRRIGEEECERGQGGRRRRPGRRGRVAGVFVGVQAASRVARMRRGTEGLPRRGNPSRWLRGGRACWGLQGARGKGGGGVTHVKGLPPRRAVQVTAVTAVSPRTCPARANTPRLPSRAYQGGRGSHGGQFGGAGPVALPGRRGGLPTTCTLRTASRCERAACAERVRCPGASPYSGRGSCLAARGTPKLEPKSLSNSLASQVPYITICARGLLLGCSGPRGTARRTKGPGTPAAGPLGPAPPPAVPETLP